MSKAATVKVDYKPGFSLDSVKGQSFHVIEEFNRFVALDINGIVCDFAKSEVEIFDDWGLFDPKCQKMN